MKTSENPYSSPYGTWEVTTEGDCEGRSMTSLGTFTGYVDEIALYLANKAYYSLNFRAQKKQPERLTPTETSVTVSFDIESETWDFTPLERAAYFKELFKDRPVKIERVGMFACFKISVEKEETREELIKAQALKKLTDEEKIALGL